MEIPLYEHTKYEKIYKKVNWGTLNGNTAEPDNEIINNRNKFIEDFKIKNVINMPRSLWSFINTNNNRRFDHVETYKTENKEIIVIVSPYYNGHEIDYPEEVGFTRYNKLYANDARTFIAVISENWRSKLSLIKKELKQHLKEDKPELLLRSESFENSCRHDKYIVKYILTRLINDNLDFALHLYS